MAFTEEHKSKLGKILLDLKREKGVTRRRGQVVINPKKQQEELARTKEDLDRLAAGVSPFSLTADDATRGFSDQLNVLKNRLLSQIDTLANVRLSPRERQARQDEFRRSVQDFERDIGSFYADVKRKKEEKKKKKEKEGKKQKEEGQKPDDKATIEKKLQATIGKYVYADGPDGKEVAGKIIGARTNAAGELIVTAEYPTGRKNVVLSRAGLDAIAEKTHEAAEKQRISITTGREPQIRAPVVAPSVNIPTPSIPTAPTITIPSAPAVSAPSTSAGVQSAVAGASAQIEVGLPAAAAAAGVAAIAGDAATELAASQQAIIKQYQQQLVNLVSSLEAVQNPASEEGTKLMAQVSDLRRDLRADTRASPSPQLNQMFQKAGELRDTFRQARQTAAANPEQARVNLGSFLQSVKTDLGLPAPTAPVVRITGAPVTPAPATVAAPTEVPVPIPPLPLATPAPAAPTVPELLRAGGVSPRRPAAPTLAASRAGAPRGPIPRTPSSFLAAIGGGRGARNVAMATALNLLAGQQLERRTTGGTGSRTEVEQIAGGDTELAGSSLSERGEESSESVLELAFKPRSYTEEQIPSVEAPLAGGGLMQTPTMELERVRAEEAQMRRTQAQLVRAPEAGAAPRAAAAPPATPGEAPSSVTPEGVEAPEAEEEEVAGDLESARLRALRQREQERRIAQQQAQQQARQIKKEMQKKMLDQIKMANGALSIETIAITLLINLALWNIQGINKYIFKNDLIPDQSFPEDMLCVTCDFYMCFNGIFCSPPCFLGPVLIFFGTAIYFAGKLGIFKVFKVF